MSETTQQRIERIAEQTTCKIYAQCDEYWHDIPCRHRDRIKELIASALTAFAEERDSEAMSALKALMPFALEDYYPTCATKDYYEAMERCIKLTGIGTPTPAPSTGEKPE